MFNFQNQAQSLITKVTSWIFKLSNPANVLT